MPININGGSRSAGGWWAKHLQNGEKNERVELIEIVGLSAENIPDAFREMRALSVNTNCSNYFYQANINPREDEQLTPAQRREAVDTLEKNLGLTGQPRFVVEHEKKGRIHTHVIWSRIDTERGVAISDSLTAPIHERTSRELEIKFDLQRGRSILVPNRDFERPERRPKKAEMFRGEQTGIDPRNVGDELKALRQRCDSGQSFKAGLEASGYMLARGDRRDFVIIDQAGDDHSVARRLGVKVAEVRELMKDIDPASLPSVKEAKTRQRARETAREVREKHGREAAREVTAREHSTDGPENGKQRRAGRPRKNGAGKDSSKRALGKTAGDFRMAWTLTRMSGNLTEALEARSITLAIVTAAEAAESKERAELARKFRQHGVDPKKNDAGRYGVLHETERPIAKELRRFAPTINEGEIVAVNGRGDVYRIDQRMTGDLRAEIDKRLGLIDRQNIPSVTDAKEVMREANEAAFAEQQRTEWEKRRPATGIETKIADALKSTMTGHEFTEAIDKAGVAIVRTTAADLKALDALRHDDQLAAAIGDEVSGQRFAKLEIGDFAAVTSGGNVFKLNPHKLDLTEIEQRLADTQRRMPSVVEARAGFEVARNDETALWEQRTADNTARRVMRSEAKEADRTIRSTAATVRRDTRKTVKAAGKIVGKGAGILGRVAAFLASLKIFEIAPAKPPSRAQQKRNLLAAKQQQAAGEIEAQQEAAAGARAQQQKTQRQEKDLRLAQILGTPPTAEANLNRDEHDRQRQHERESGRDL